jgi:hypothetical protein
MARLGFVAVVGFVFGSIMLVAWLPRLAVTRSPVITGNVVARTPIMEWGVPRADFTIEIPGSAVVVHAHTQRYLLKQIPAQVRFHYSGDPSRQVYLFDHEENPLWIGLTCWAVSAVLGAPCVLLLRARLASFRNAAALPIVPTGGGEPN